MDEGASLVMEDCRVFGRGLECLGDVTATRCTFEDNSSSGVWVEHTNGSANPTECLILINGFGVWVTRGGKAMLRGGTISGNKRHGVAASSKVTVAKAEEGKPQTVRKDNKQCPDGAFGVQLYGPEHDWHTEKSGQIIGISQEKINV